MTSVSRPPFPKTRWLAHEKTSNAVPLSSVTGAGLRPCSPEIEMRTVPSVPLCRTVVLSHEMSDRL